MSKSIFKCFWCENCYKIEGHDIKWYCGTGSRINPICENCQRDFHSSSEMKRKLILKEAANETKRLEKKNPKKR